MTYNEFIQLAQERFSCRSYKPLLPSNDELRKVVEAAHIAPSECNKQPWKFVIATSDKARKAIAAAYSRDWINTAPAFIVAVGNHSEAWHRANFDNKDHTDVDLSIAIEHMCLAATSLGLGTCWVCNFNPQALNEALNLDKGLEAIAILPIGYPADECTVPVKQRKPIEQITEWM